MRNQFRRCWRFTILGSLVLLVRGYRASANEDAPPRDALLRSAIQHYLQGPPLRNFEPTSYLFAFVDLTGEEKQQAVVYLTGRQWCGSSGCQMLVLTRDRSSFKVISRIPGVKLPIRVLHTRSHGWRDLSVFIQGGGTLDGYNEVIKFDGDRYREQDSSRTRIAQLGGSIILSRKDKEVPLYP